MTASARGSVASGSWWSVMIRSTPSSRARSAASAARMPQSTDTMTARPSACRRSMVDRLQPVAVLEPLGDEVRDVAAQQFDRAAQDDGGRDAVDVVVAVDDDALRAARWRRCSRSTASRMPASGKDRAVATVGVEEAAAPRRDRTGRAGTAAARSPAARRAPRPSAATCASSAGTSSQTERTITGRPRRRLAPLGPSSVNACPSRPWRGTWHSAPRAGRPAPIALQLAPGAATSASSTSAAAAAVVEVRAADRLLDDLVDDAEPSRSGAVILSASAASTLRAASRHRMAAHPSGGITL